LFELAKKKRMDLTHLMRHHFTLGQNPRAYRIFEEQQDEVSMVAIRPSDKSALLIRFIIETRIIE